ncbi:MAG: malto-oligosyltrehalose synthase [Salinimicrobium sp.]
MKNPVATYRLQLSPDFDFEDLEEIIDYLDELGISTIYSAPFFQARKGSSHGYDITDPLRINKQIGRLDRFKKISRKLQQKGMGWLQDIVPNHMAFDGQNTWLQDVFELGPRSVYFNFFDVDWNDEDPKLMAPFLGDPLEEVLQKGEFQLLLSSRGFIFRYYDQQYFAAARSYADVLTPSEFPEWHKRFKAFKGDASAWMELKNFFLREVDRDADLEQKTEKRLEQIDDSKEELRALLKRQFFLPAHWKATEKKINYRRFFTINDLICLSMEDREVFENYHRFIFQLCEQNLINGLRIDHIDGLFDPLTYVKNLRETLGPDFYIIIEKILEWDEKLPNHWPVEGTSGYGFLAEVNQVLTEEKNEQLFTEKYQEINPQNSAYAELVYKQKLFILQERMGGEYANLWELSTELDLLADQQKNEKYKQALGALLAGFPVYRIYPESFPLNRRQENIVKTAYRSALEFYEDHEQELNTWKALFLGKAKRDKGDMLYFLQRCQQFTGPLAAKGVEDTTFYIFNRLISHNEVGDSPENFGLTVAGFHQRMQLRQSDFPLSVNATATHDTKRGEDARMRINVLSELGEEWFQKVEEWKEISADFRKDEKIPDANEEYFIFQMIVGHWPSQDFSMEKLLKRTRGFLQKMLREAKQHSSWAKPDEAYENAVFEYVESLLKNDKFRKSFREFHNKINAYGAAKSLSQCLLKITAPGIPDIYQGTELWDFSYVDPDNRRPVDYALRKKYLQEMTSYSKDELEVKLKQLKKEFTNGKINMYCLYKALKFRMRQKQLFEEGSYVPLKLAAEYAEGVVAYARQKGENYALIFAPATVTNFFNEQLEPKPEVEAQQLFSLPKGFPKQWKNIFTGEKFENEEAFHPGQLFKHFPVALLTNIDAA